MTAYAPTFLLPGTDQILDTSNFIKKYSNEFPVYGIL